jgi:hypothetical protein
MDSIFHHQYNNIRQVFLYGKYIPPSIQQYNPPSIQQYNPPSIQQYTESIFHHQFNTQQYTESIFQQSQLIQTAVNTVIYE